MTNKIETLILDKDLKPLFSDIESFLKKQDIDSYIVGGFVRDTLIGKRTADIDMVISKCPSRILIKLAEKLKGTLILMDRENQIYRIVSGQSKWHIDISLLKTDIYEDLKQRDYTVNAMALPLSEIADNIDRKSIIDPYNGLNDLDKSLIRAVSSDIFIKDPIRLIRAIRLSAELSMEIDPETVRLIEINCNLIEKSAKERIREELCRILNTDNAADWLYYLDKLGLLKHIIPELEVMRGIEQPKEHYWDVFHHSIETVRNVDRITKLIPDDKSQIIQQLYWSREYSEYFDKEVTNGVNRRTILKIAALLHDICKPETKALMPDGRTRFLGHAERGSEIAEQVLERLRFSRTEISMVSDMIRYHLRPTQMCTEGLPTRRAIYRFFRDTGDVAIDVLFLSLSDHLATRGPNIDIEAWRYHVDTTKYVLDEHVRDREIAQPPKLVDGHDIMRIFQLQPGPVIGNILESIREAQASGEIVSKEEAIDLISQELKKQGALNAS